MSAGNAKGTEPILGYRLIERLGAGGFGEVWKAEAPGGLTKAIKFVYGALAQKLASQELQAFERIKGVRHPFILSLERVEIAGGRLIIVSELADKTLWERFEECRAAGARGIARAELLRDLHDAADALDYMTEEFQLQHLDIKPSNLFLVGGRLKVGDFGLVRDVYQDSLTSGGLSPAYAAPESFTGDVSRYSDQYALAVVYQEMLTGVRPFRSSSAHHSSAPPLQDCPNLAPLGPDDRAVIARALSRNPRDRFPTCAALVSALENVPERESAHPLPAAEIDTAPDHRSPSPPQAGAWRAGDLPAADPTQGTLATLATCPASPSPAPAVWMARESITDDTREPTAPEPTLFIGIGGTAARVLGHAKQLFQSRFANDAAKLPLGWLFLDTDADTLKAATQVGGLNRLEPEQTLLMPLHGPDHYRGRSELLGWLGRRWLYRIPRSHRTEGLRPLGRLALIDNAEIVLLRLQQAIRQTIAKVENNAYEHLKVIVIASISGGTGGGCLADVGFAVRRILREEGRARTPVEAVLILGASVLREQNELSRASAYATLTELNHFLDPDTPFPEERALGSRAVEPRARPFDALDLVDLGAMRSEEDLESGAHLTAEYLRLARGTPYGRTLESSRGPRAAATGTPLVKSFRLARFGFPRSELRRVVAGEVATRVLTHWLGVAAVDSVAAEAERLYAQLEVDEESFFEIIAERAERALGVDPRKLGRRAADEIVQARTRAEGDQVIRWFFDQMDTLIGSGTVNEDIAPANLRAKLHREFKADGTNRQEQLVTWLRAIVENPAQRLKAAVGAEAAITRKLAAAAEETQSRLMAIRGQRVEIRNRCLGAGTQRLVPNLLKNLRAETPVQSADRLREYGQLCESEIALAVRAEILSNLRASAARMTLEFDRIREGLTGVVRRFQGHAPCALKSAHAAIGSSVEVLPLAASDGADVAASLAESFCSERWLDAFGRRLQQEVLEPHGGLAAVMAREPRFVVEWLHTTLMDRAEAAVDLWLEDMDAASLLMRRYGSAREVENALRPCLKSAAFPAAEQGGRRIIVGTPGSPSGRSLRERLAESQTIAVADFVTIPEDVVVCLELEDLSLSSAAANLVSGQTLLVDLASKLMTREDVNWVPLNPPD